MNDISQEQGIIAAADSSFASAAEASSVLNAAVASAEQAAESLAAAEVVEIAEGAEDVDRKSTRLNSSHLVISYAVFCLKKKTDLARRGHSYLYNKVDHGNTTPSEPPS